MKSGSRDVHAETHFIEDKHIVKRELHAHCNPDVSSNIEYPSLCSVLVLVLLKG